MRIKVGFRGKSIGIDVRKVSFVGKFTGLMFKAKKTENLLFEFRKKEKWAIHSWFVFFPFLALWLDEKNKVIEHKIVRPFRSSVRPEKKFLRLVEVPINMRNREIIRLFTNG
jgi:uncharacterized membrane protein (UPF0127 family)